MTGAGFLVLVLVGSVGSALVLYALVRAENDRRRVMDRESAENVARRDRPDERRE